MTPSAETGAVPPAARGRALVSWCLYDWANSAFPTVVITFVFATYFTTAVAETPTAGTAQWGRALSLSALVVALLSPVFGAVADRGGRRKPWLLAFTLVCVAATAMLWFIRPAPDYVLWALALVFVSSAAFDFAAVFYNSMLPAITPPAYLGRMSGWGWAFGYAGGLACLVLALAGLVRAESPWLGLDAGAAEPVRATVLLVALWYALFSLPLFAFTPDHAATGVRASAAIRTGVATLWRTLRNVRRYAGIGRFLLARMIYTDGLATLFLFAGVYAAGTFAMSVAEVTRLGIALNVTAGLGAAAFAWIDDWIGSLRTVAIALVCLTALAAAVLLIQSKELFWIVALAVGVFVGPVQAASRSLMARLAPEELQTEMFGLYAFSGKATAFLGPLLVGTVTEAFDSQRAGMSTILVFFVVGLLLLLPLRKTVR